MITAVSLGVCSFLIIIMMETVTKIIQAGDCVAVLTALKQFTEENKTNFNLGESPDTRKAFCSAVLGLLQEEGKWSPKILSLALNALRIFAREHQGVEGLISREGLLVIAQLAGLSAHDPEEDIPADRLEVVVEATKVLCNIVLNHRYLAPLTADIGCLTGLSSRLSLAATSQRPHDLLFFDLRLLFLITACGPAERVMFRDSCNGIPVLVNLVDAALFGPSPKGGSVSVQATPTDEDVPRLKVSPCNLTREGVACLTTPISVRQCSVLCEALKILFNQTLNWKEEYDEDELCLWGRLSQLVRILLISLPLHRDKTTTDTISHCAEILVNTPEQCAVWFLLPRDVQVMPTIRPLYPDIYNGDGLYASNLDCVCGDWNMSAVLSLINYLHWQLGCDSERSRLSPTLTALRVLAKGHRIIRRYLRSIILPTLKEITQRPDEGNSLKSMIVRLMTAGSMGAEEVTADLLFVLCKENVSRLVKHTGFGNAAGLLMSRGLLGGGRCEGEEQYSSDSESSDTEEYQRSRDKLDPVTAGPGDVEDGPSPLDHMTDEEKEIEAEKLAELFDKLNRHGVIKVMPVGKDGKPVLDKSDED